MAQNKDFKIKNGLQVGGATSLSDSLSVTGNLTIYGRGTITIGGDTFSIVLDSDLTTSLIDSAYVQLIQADLQRDSGFISSVITGGTLNMGANNIITTGKILSSEQNLIYSEIDKTLLDNCCHEWEDDIIEGPLDSEINICYCKKCLYYKKK